MGLSSSTALEDMVLLCEFYECVHTCTCACAYMHVGAYLWRPDVECHFAQCHPFNSWLFQMEFSYWTQCSLIHLLSGQWTPIPRPSIGIINTHQHTQLSTWMLGSNTGPHVHVAVTLPTEASLQTLLCRFDRTSSRDHLVYIQILPMSLMLLPHPAT